MKLTKEQGQYLKDRYQTPLFLYDVRELKSRMDSLKKHFVSKLFDTEILYASKAFSVKAMIQLVQERGLSLDVVSLGELYTAEQVGFDFHHIYFHGNNKTEEELRYAVEKSVGTIIVDNEMELKRLADISSELKKKVNVLIRLNLGIEAHTHQYIVTAHIDSKFGVAYHSEEFKRMEEVLLESPYLDFDGFHSHIGSQIFDLRPFDAAIEKLIAICRDYNQPLVLNIGGGFGVTYTKADHPVSLQDVATHLIKTTERLLKQEAIVLKKLCIEPGRSIVAEAGSTLYTIGFQKQTPNKLYYFVDGGMTDNIRPALYQAQYECRILGKEDSFKNRLVTIAGKCCESGDILIENCLLPPALPGDLLLMNTTGAYGYSMSSNYNKICLPAVVFLEDGTDRLVVRRQTLEELIEREV